MVYNPVRAIVQSTSFQWWSCIYHVHKGIASWNKFHWLISVELLSIVATSFTTDSSTILNFFSRTEIKRIRGSAGVAANVCPVDDCDVVLGDALMATHVGVDHGVVLTMYAKKVSGSPAGNALDAYRKSLGFNNVVCDLKINSNSTCGWDDGPFCIINNNGGKR